MLSPFVSFPFLLVAFVIVSGQADAETLVKRSSRSNRTGHSYESLTGSKYDRIASWTPEPGAGGAPSQYSAAPSSLGRSYFYGGRSAGSAGGGYSQNGAQSSYRGSNGGGYSQNGAQSSYRGGSGGAQSSYRGSSAGGYSQGGAQSSYRGSSVGGYSQGGAQSSYRGSNAGGTYAGASSAGYGGGSNYGGYQSSAGAPIQGQVMEVTLPCEHGPIKDLTQNRRWHKELGKYIKPQGKPCSARGRSYWDVC